MATELRNGTKMSNPTHINNSNRYNYKYKYSYIIYA